VECGVCRSIKFLFKTQANNMISPRNWVPEPGSQIHYLVPNPGNW